MLRQGSKLNIFATVLASQEYSEFFNFKKMEDNDFTEKISIFTRPFQSLFDIIKNHFDIIEGIRIKSTDMHELKFEKDEFVDIMMADNGWEILEAESNITSGAQVRMIIKELIKHEKLAEIINRTLQKSNINLMFKDFCHCIEMLVSCRNVNQHIPKKGGKIEFTELRDIQDRKMITKTYNRLFDKQDVRKYLPHFIASLYYLFNIADQVFSKECIPKSLLELWKEFPDFAEKNEENSITKIMDSLSGRSWGYKDQYIDRQGRLQKLVDELKTSSIVTIFGEGGIGKTELVYQALKEIDANNNSGVKFSNILPFTFKSDLQGEYDDESGGTKSVERGIWSPQPLFHDVIKTLAEESGKWNDLANQGEMKKCAIEYLLTNDLIVVIDNTEVIEESEFNYQLEDFISSFVEGSDFETKSRIIITSRISPGDRQGSHIKMKYLNVAEMTELAIARGNWLVTNHSNDATPHSHLSQNYTGWEGLTDYVNNELSMHEKELVGHPLFVFLCVRELLFNNPSDLQIHELIMELIKDYNPDSKMERLFNYITERSIASINELPQWANILMDMIEMETFSEKMIKESIDRHNKNEKSADIIERLLALDIIRVLNSEEFETYQFKSRFYVSNMKTQIQSLDSYEGENTTIKNVNDYNKLITYISERPLANVKYIINEKRYLELENRSVNLFNIDWINMTNTLACASHDLISDIDNSDSIISFMDQQQYSDQILPILSRYLNICCNKLCDDFEKQPRTNRFRDLVNLLTKLEGMDNVLFCKTRIKIFSILSERMSRVYSTEIHAPSISLTHYLMRNLKHNDNLSQLPVNVIKLINCMISRCGDEMKTNLFNILSTTNIQETKGKIFDHIDAICRTLSRTPEYQKMLLEVDSPTFFEQMANEENVQNNNLRKFDIFKITTPVNFVATNPINFTKDGVEYIISKCPSTLTANSTIKCQVIWKGLSNNASDRIYAIYNNHEASIPPTNELIFQIDIKNPIKLLSKQRMFELLSEIVVERKTSASKLFGEMLPPKLIDEEYDFTWSQWKIAAYPDPNEQKIRHIVDDISGSQWRVPQLSSGNNIYILTSTTNIDNNEPRVFTERKTPLTLSDLVRNKRKSHRAKNLQREEE